MIATTTGLSSAAELAGAVLTPFGTTAMAMARGAYSCKKMMIAAPGEAFSLQYYGRKNCFVFLTVPYMADTIGLITLAALVGLASFFVADTVIPLGMWIFIYLIWVMCALFIWHHGMAPEKSLTWLTLALCSVIAAPICYGLTALAALVFFGDSQPALSSMFDLITTLICAPGLTFIAVTGWVRALMLARFSHRKKITL